MAWSYRNRTTTLPDVQLTISKSGISTSFPGISQESAGRHLQGVQASVLAACRQWKEMEHDLSSIGRALTRSRLKLAASFLLLYGFAKPSVSSRLRMNIRNQKTARDTVREQMENGGLTLRVSFDEELKKKYEKIAKAFKKLMLSERVWDISIAFAGNQLQINEATTVPESRQEVRFGVKSLPFLKTDCLGLWLKNAAGNHLLLYPTFAVIYSMQEQFTVIGLDELELSFSEARTVEEGDVPGETTIVGHAWPASPNSRKSGRRYSDNEQLPVARYGQIVLKGDNGLFEAFQFSNYEHAKEFSAAFNEYKKELKSLQEVEGRHLVA